MGSSVEFQPYLDSIIRHYGKWQRLYTLTDAEGRKAEEAEETPFFDFGLMVQSVVKAEPDESSAAGEEPKEKIERFTVLEGLRKYADEHVLLVGRPGSGKSTALARLMLEIGTAALSPSPSPKFGRGEFEGQPVPVLVELRSWQTSVLELVRGFLKRHGLRFSVEQVEALLDEGRLVLLVDGVNELPSEAARRNVNEFRKNHRQVSMVFTTRDLGLGGDLGIGKKLEMQPLTDQQMRAFVEAYLPGKAEGMLWQLQGRLRELGQTPLLLWMLCSVFRQQEEIPQNLGEVFRAFTRGYEQRIKQDVVVESDRRLWPGLLQELAAAMMQGETRVDFRVAIAPSDVHHTFSAYLATENPLAPHRALDDLLKHHLIKRNGDLIEFQHQLIQEYYAGEWLLERIGEIDESTLSKNYLNHKKWTESIAFALSLLDNQDSCERILEQAKEVDFLIGSRLSGEVCVRLQKFAFDHFFEDKHLSPLMLLGLKESSSKSAIPLLREMLNQSNQDFRKIAVTILGNIRSTESLDILENTIFDSDEVIRGESAQALEKFSSLEVIALLQRCKSNEKSVYARIRIETALWHLCGDKEMPTLLRPIEYPALPQEEQYAFRFEDGSIDIAKIKNAIRRWPFLNSEFFEDGLSNVPESEVSDLIISKLIDDFESTGLKSWNILSILNSRELNQQHFERLREVLLKCSASIFPPLRAEAVKAIGKSTDSNRIVLLHFFMSDPDSRVKRAAIYALSDRGSEAELKILGDELLERSSDDCMYLIEAIVQSNSNMAEPYLLAKIEQLEIAEVDNSWLIKTIIKALGKVGTYNLLPMLSHRREACDDYEEAYLLSQAIYSIQARCGFYNYDIFHSPIDHSKTQMSNTSQTQNIFNISSVGSLNTGNVTIHGDQVGIQHNNQSNPELDQAVIQLQILLSNLQVQHPDTTNETEALAIIDAEFKVLQASQSPQWQDLLSLKRFYNGGKKAAIKVGEHFAQENPWGKGFIAFLEGFSENEQ